MRDGDDRCSIQSLGLKKALKKATFSCFFALVLNE